MSTSNILNWMDNLPAVNGSNVHNILFAAKRQEVVGLVERADTLAGEPAKEVRGDAYRVALRIESEARAVWSAEEILDAKAKGF